ncbi:MAG: molybdenum hydroxylase, partial [candidate division Zixibacteria bacterium]|nr:molybdenum hydroxylase [candidate division Zixibacteria bacterium]
TAGENCHAVVETNRGHFLGRVSWDGTAEADTGIPEAVLQHQGDRVLRSPADGIFTPVMEIGKKVKKGDILAEVGGIAIQAPFDGVIRGLLHDGIKVREGLKVGDLDPRNDPTYASLVSDKGLAVGGGVLEAILSQPVIRKNLWA